MRKKIAAVIAACLAAAGLSLLFAGTASATEGTTPSIHNISTIGIGVIHVHDANYTVAGKYDVVLASGHQTAEYPWSYAAGWYVGSAAYRSCAYKDTAGTGVTGTLAFNAVGVTGGAQIFFDTTWGNGAWVNVIAAASTCASTVTIGSAPPASGATVPGTWTLQTGASDEFTTLDSSCGKWCIYNGTATNGVSPWNPSLVSVTSGNLRINGVGTSSNGANNSGGALCQCGQGHTYGLWEVRTKFPVSKGYGEAMLLWPDSDIWPGDGELDFAELPHADKTEDIGTVHWDGGGGSDASSASTGTGTFGDGNYHTYAVNWQPAFVRFYVDGVKTYDSADHAGTVIPSTSMHLALQIEPGPFDPSTWVPAPDGTTPQPLNWDTDWVHYYTGS